MYLDFMLFYLTKITTEKFTFFRDAVVIVLQDRKVFCLKIGSLNLLLSYCCHQQFERAVEHFAIIMWPLENMVLARLMVHFIGAMDWTIDRSHATGTGSYFQVLRVHFICINIDSNRCTGSY